MLWLWVLMVGTVVLGKVYASVILEVISGLSHPIVDVLYHLTLGGIEVKRGFIRKQKKYGGRAVLRQNLISAQNFIRVHRHSRC